MLSYSVWFGVFGSLLLHGLLGHLVADVSEQAFLKKRPGLPPQVKAQFQRHTAIRPEPAQDSIEIDVPNVPQSLQEPLETHQVKPIVVNPSVAGSKLSWAETQSSGRGGDGKGEQLVRNLSAVIDSLTTSDQVKDTFHALLEQDNHLLTSTLRQSMRNYRFAREILDFTFVAVSRGSIVVHALKNQPPSRHGADSPFAKWAPFAKRHVERFDQASLSLALHPKRKERFDSLEPSDASTKKLARGLNQPLTHSIANDVPFAANARPHVDKGNPSITSSQFGPTQDNVQSDQAVTIPTASLIATTQLGALRSGQGNGGTSDGPLPGANGTQGGGATGANRAEGNGDAHLRWLLRRDSYISILLRKLAPVLRGTFPKEEQLDLRNGTLVMELTIAKDGKLLTRKLLRQSGVDEFDRNVVAAFQRVSIVEPLPDTLSQGPLVLRVPIRGGWHM